MVPASERIIGKGKRKLGRVEKGGLQCTRRKGIEGKALNEEQKMEKRCWRTMTFYLENNCCGGGGIIEWPFYKRPFTVLGHLHERRYRVQRNKLHLSREIAIE